MRKFWSLMSGGSKQSIFSAAWLIPLRMSVVASLFLIVFFNYDRYFAIIAFAQMFSFRVGFGIAVVTFFSVIALSLTTGRARPARDAAASLLAMPSYFMLLPNWAIHSFQNPNPLSVLGLSATPFLFTLLFVLMLEKDRWRETLAFFFNSVALCLFLYAEISLLKG